MLAKRQHSQIYGQVPDQKERTRNRIARHGPSALTDKRLNPNENMLVLDGVYVLVHLLAILRYRNDSLCVRVPENVFQGFVNVR
jgi:hypothetical protein